MKSLFNKKNLKKVDLLNKALGMNHRSKPYDLNRVEDLEEMLKIKVCALLDYLEYEMILEDVLERLDESIEYYDAPTWLSFTEDISEPDKLLIKCYSSTKRACYDYGKLTERTSKECMEILQVVLNGNKEVQDTILGFNVIDISYTQDQLVDIFANIYEIGNSYNMEEAYNKFIVYIKEQLIGK